MIGALFPRKAPETGKGVPQRRSRPKALKFEFYNSKSTEVRPSWEPNLGVGVVGGGVEQHDSIVQLRCVPKAPTFTIL